MILYNIKSYHSNYQISFKSSICDKRPNFGVRHIVGAIKSIARCQELSNELWVGWRARAVGYPKRLPVPRNCRIGTDWPKRSFSGRVTANSPAYRSIEGARGTYGCRLQRLDSRRRHACTGLTPSSSALRALAIQRQPHM